jgi:hypothetical protein
MGVCHKDEKQTHQERHIFLHKCFDELAADFYTNVLMNLPPILHNTQDNFFQKLQYFSYCSGLTGKLYLQLKQKN